MLQLADYRSKAEGLPDLLPYAALIAPGIVMNKDGSLLCAWQVWGRDTASSTYTEMAWVSQMANEALKLLGNGWMLHMNAIRDYSRAYPDRKASQYPDIVTQIIDDERRRFFGSDWCYSTRLYFTLTYKPDLQAARIASQTKGIKSDVVAENMELFEGTILQVEDILSAVLHMEFLSEKKRENSYESYMVSDLLSYLQECITGNYQPIRVPANPMYLDGILGGEDLLIDGTDPVLGGKRIAAISLGTFPMESWPGMLSQLEGISISYRFSTRYIFLDQWDAIKEINKYRKGWQQGMIRFIDQMTNKANPRINKDAAQMTEDAEIAEQEVRSGAVNAGFLTSAIFLMSENQKELIDQSREVRRILQRIGFTSRIETINALEAWLGSIPGNSWADIRRPLVNTLNTADLLPLASVWTGAEFNPCPFYPPNSRCLAVLTTDGSTPFRLNLHSGDLAHTLVLGPTGAGKSTLLALLAAQFRVYPKASIFAFDKGLSMYALAKGANGDHYDIGGGALSFAPLQRIDVSDAEFTFAANWIATLAELQKLPILPIHRNAIFTALDTLKNNPDTMRSLTHFWHVLQNQELKDALQHYTTAGAMGKLLDAETDSLDFSRFMVFEIETLMEMGEANVIPVLLYLFHRIEAALDGQPAFLFLDEAWIMLGHPVFREKIREWLKTFRKKNCGVILATQSISDADKSGILDVLAESCPTKIYLANTEAKGEKQSVFYEMMGLNQRQISIISQMTPKRDYYITQPEGRRKVQLALGRQTLSFIGVSDKENLNRINELIVSRPDDWQTAWLTERGCGLSTPKN